MRVVLDSNILFSALISPHGPPHRIFQAWRTKRFELVTCSIQLDEIRRASRYPKFRDILKPHRVGRMVNDLHGAILIDTLSREFEAASGLGNRLSGWAGACVCRGGGLGG